MKTIHRYAKAIVKKVLAAVSITALITLKVVFSVILFLYKIVSIPSAIICAINGAINLYGGVTYDAIASFALAAIVIALLFILPAALPLIDKGITRLARVLRKPLVYKSRLTYTFG